MGMSSTVGNVGSLLNSGLTLQNNQQGNQQSNQGSFGSPQIGMPMVNPSTGQGYTQPGKSNFDPSGMKQLGWSGAAPAVIGWEPPKAYIDNQGNYFDANGNSLTFTPNSASPNIFGDSNTPWNQTHGTLKDSQGNPYGMGQFTAGGKNMPAPMPDQGAQPMFNLPNPAPIDMPGQIGLPAGPGYMQPGQNPFDFPVERGGLATNTGIYKPVNRDLFDANGQLKTETPNLGTPQIGMPAGPGYMQPQASRRGDFFNSPEYKNFNGNGIYADSMDIYTSPYFGRTGGSVRGGQLDRAYEAYLQRTGQKAGYGINKDYNMVDDLLGLNPTPLPTPTPNIGQPTIGMPAGPGYMQPTPLPSPTVKAQPTPLPPATGPNLGQPQIGMPAGPGYMQPKAQPTPLPKPAPAPVLKPIVRPAPIPQTKQQIVQQVGLRQNPRAPTKVQPSLSTRPTGSLRRR